MKNYVDFEIGNILLGENNHPIDGNHYIVYYKDIDRRDFEGCMISTKPHNNINKSMMPEHFEVVNAETGNDWPITYKNSYLVPAKLHKFNEMGPFTKVGQLTEEGILFITGIIAPKRLTPWEVYKVQ